LQARPDIGQLEQRPPLLGDQVINLAKPQPIRMSEPAAENEREVEHRRSSCRDGHRRKTWLRRGPAEPVSYLKMFTARAVTSRMLIAEIPDSDSISSFAQRLSGIASVGLNAIEFVKEM
jgi:hypothetical protein